MKHYHFTCLSLNLAKFGSFLQVFEQVTIVFNDVPAFIDICAKCDGMKIVETLNTMFGIFDLLSDRNGVYKVETVKDSFVGVCGAPERVRLLLTTIVVKLDEAQQIKP